MGDEEIERMQDEADRALEALSEEQRAALGFLNGLPVEPDALEKAKQEMAECEKHWDPDYGPSIHVVQGYAAIAQAEAAQRQAAALERIADALEAYWQ